MDGRKSKNFMMGFQVIERVDIINILLDRSRDEKRVIINVLFCAFFRHHELADSHILTEIFRVRVRITVRDHLGLD